MIKLAIVARVSAPYRVHQHLRIAKELGDAVELYSLFLFEKNNLPWMQSLPDAIRPVMFGAGENVEAKSTLRSIIHERRKMKKVIRWLSDNQIDAVITVGYSHPGHPMLISWCRHRGIPNFLYGDSNVHGDMAKGVRRQIKIAYVSWVLRNVTAVLPHSRHGRQYYEVYGGRDKPMFYMPQEPDYSKIFEVTAERRAEVRRKYRLTDGRKYILYSGRLAPVKRVDTLINAFARVAEQRPDWNLLVVGSGPLEKQLRANVPAELEDRIVWTGFVNDSAEMAALNAAADLFVLPSSYEPWALVVCEAAAAGLPIISSNVVGAAGELVREGVNGRLFNPGDTEELSRAILDVTESDERLEEYSRGSLKVLDDWRRRGDPIYGLRQALAFAGLLRTTAPPSNPSPKTPDVPKWRRVVSLPGGETFN